MKNFQNSRFWISWSFGLVSNRHGWQINFFEYETVQQIVNVFSGCSNWFHRSMPFSSSNTFRRLKRMLFCSEMRRGEKDLCRWTICLTAGLVLKPVAFVTSSTVRLSFLHFMRLLCRALRLSLSNLGCRSLSNSSRSSNVIQRINAARTCAITLLGFPMSGQRTKRETLYSNWNPCLSSYRRESTTFEARNFVPVPTVFFYRPISLLQKGRKKTLEEVQKWNLQLP